MVPPHRRRSRCRRGDRVGQLLGGRPAQIRQGNEPQAVLAPKLPDSLIQHVMSGGPFALPGRELARRISWIGTIPVCQCSAQQVAELGQGLYASNSAADGSSPDAEARSDADKAGAATLLPLPVLRGRVGVVGVWAR